MFVVTLTYLAELDAIDEAMRRHVAYLKKGYAEGVFLASGRQVPRTGGVILAAAIERSELERRIQEDPFVSEGLAEAAIVEFTPSQTAKGLERRRGGRQMLSAGTRMSRR